MKKMYGHISKERISKRTVGEANDTWNQLEANT
jgi:hypothetical protein